MTVSIPLVALLAVAMWLAWRYMGLRAGHAVVCLLFGFFLAATGFAPEIRRVVGALIQALTHSQP